MFGCCTNLGEMIRTLYATTTSVCMCVCGFSVYNADPSPAVIHWRNQILMFDKVVMQCFSRKGTHYWYVNVIITVHFTTQKRNNKKKTDNLLHEIFPYLCLRFVQVFYFKNLPCLICANIRICVLHTMSNGMVSFFRYF